MAANDESHPTDRLEGRAPAVAALREQIRRLVTFDAVGTPVPPLLLVGETGTGKGLVARIVHDSGPRSGGPFIQVNCAAIPETMLEAELFGYEAGAFTDAKRGKAGLFEAAQRGTLFLDEIDSLAVSLQAKLLTAIEGRRVRRLGAVAEHDVDVKLVVATQQELESLVATGGFRPDLYHRLAVVVLELPPLRARGEDVVELASALLARYGIGYRATGRRLTDDAEAWLRRQRWPGNVRELSHLMERVTLLHPGTEVDAAALERLVRPTSPGADAAAGEAEPAADDAAEIRSALARAGGNVVKAARLLGISRDTIRYRMRRHGIGRPGVEDLRGAPHRAPAPPPRCRGRASRRARTAPPQDTTAPAWEQKHAAVVAIEVTWPEPGPGETPSYEPWTEAARWERAIAEKLGGLGGVPLRAGPTLMLWAFGVPRAVDQLQERAVQGALAVREIVASVAAPELPPRMRIAVHSGPVLVDPRAADPDRQVLPIGDTVSLPLRLIAEAMPGEILLTAEVSRHAERWATLEPREVSARGLREMGAPVHTLTALRPARERGPRGAQRALAAFVGRERELETLEELMRAAEAGAGQAVGIVGEPGSGKSRLLFELRQRVRPRGVRYMEQHCLAYGSMTPYGPLLDTLPAYFLIDPRDAWPVVIEKVRLGLEFVELDPDEHEPYILHLLGAPGAAERLGGVDPRTLKERTLDTLCQVLLGTSRAQPLVFVVENAHWIDPTSEELSSGVVDRLAGAPIVFVMSYRPPYRPRWLDKSYATQIALRPLGADRSRELIRHLAAGSALRPGVEEQILARAEGNPFFLEELVRSVVEQGATLGDLAIPDSVQAVLAARIDRLPPGDKQLLQSAAVVGRDVPVGLLERVVDLPGPALREALARLRAAEFLYEVQGQAAYTFTHALTQAAAYAGLPAEPRRGLHLKVAEALEEAGGEARPELVEQLAHHAAHGGAWGKALGYLRQAAELATARGARREAIACYEQALTALDRLPGTLDQTAELRFRYAHALYMAGQFTPALAAFVAARGAVEALGDTKRLARVETGRSFVLASEGRYAEAAEAGERALALTTADVDAPEALWTRFGVARAQFALGNYRRGIECARWALDALAGRPVDERFGGRAGQLLPSVAARTWLALCQAQTGDFDEGIVHGEEGVRVAEDVNGLLERVWAYYCLGRVHQGRGAFDRAVPLLRRAAELCEGGTVPIYFTRVLSGLGSALYQSGAVAEALPLLRRAIDEAGAINLLYGHSLILVQLGGAHLAGGQRAEAARHAAEALEMSRARGARGDEARALHLHGDIAAGGEPDAVPAALEWYAQALALAEELGMRPLAARCRLGRGQVLAALGRPDEAREDLTRARDEFAGMKIERLRGRAAAVLGRLPT